MGRMDEAYRTRIEAGGLEPDPAQLAVLPEFERIARELDALAASRRGLGGLFAKKPEPVRGLYLWGGVGRGKSMLMDLFHEIEGGPQSRRVHFHGDNKLP